MKNAYIHIPFCKTICTYCDFCKMYYNTKWVNVYLDSLEKEIDSKYKNEILSTIYIGGGTPNSLSNEELERLFKIVDRLNKDKAYEYTIECNIELLTLDQILLMKRYGINRVSIGVQTFNAKYLEFLNRHHTSSMVKEKIDLLKKYDINNINVDLIYAIPGETLEQLSEDIEIIKTLDIPHISTYSLIIEANTVLSKLHTKNISEDLDYDMYNLIIERLNNYKHYETSNFSKEGYESKHNLTYWNNEHYYGFGLGASGYIDDVRYENTKSLNHYLEGKYVLEKSTLTKNEVIENEFILGFRKLEGININRFKEKYDIDILKLDVVLELLEKGKLINDGSNIKINNNYVYTANDILINFLGIDYEK